MSIAAFVSGAALSLGSAQSNINPPRPVKNMRDVERVFDDVYAKLDAAEEAAKALEAEDAAPIVAEVQNLLGELCRIKDCMKLSSESPPTRREDG